MENKMKNYSLKKIFVVGIIFVMLSSFVVAYGVLSEYTKDRAMPIFSGESKDT